MASGLQAVKAEDIGENESDWLGRMAPLASKILEKQDLACLHIPFSAWMMPEGQPASSSLFVEHLQHIDEHLIGPLWQACAGNRRCAALRCCHSLRQQSEGGGASSCAVCAL